MSRISSFSILAIVLLLPLLAAPSSSAPEVAVFTDGFSDTSQWQSLSLPPMTGSNPLTLTTQRNHNGYAGEYSLRTVVSAEGSLTGRTFAVPFATARFQTWFYDGDGMLYSAPFELSTEGWQSYPAAFATLTSAPGGVSGNCLRADDGGFTCGYYKVISSGFETGSAYTFTIWVKWNTPPPGTGWMTQPRCFVKFFDGSDELHTDYSPNITADGTWRQIQITGNIPETTTDIWIGAYGILNNVADYHYYADSAEFTESYIGWVSDWSRQGLQVRSIDTSNQTTKAAYFLGAYSDVGSPNSEHYYSAGVYSSCGPGCGNWTWHYGLRLRTHGWHRLEIDFLPYTGSGDVRMYIDGSLAAVLDRTPETMTYGLNLEALGCHEPVVVSGWFDDAALYAEPPDAPIAGAPVAGLTDIQWPYTDNSTKEMGYHLIDGSQQTVKTAGYLPGTGTVSSFHETGLSPNTPYTRSIRGYNGSLNGAATPQVTKWTLAVPPTPSTVTCNKSEGIYYRGANFIFTAVGGFGQGKISSYEYVWNQSPTYTFTGGESIWNSGSLTVTAATAGQWYLHIRALNGEGIPNGTLDLGPYGYAPIPLTPQVTLDGPYSPPGQIIKATWTASQSAAPVIDYEYAVGTSASTQNIVGWTSAGLTLNASISIPNPGLQAGNTYYVFVRAKDSDFLYSNPGVSPPLQILTPSINTGTGLAGADGTPIALSGLRVSRTFPAGGFAQAFDRSAGIRIDGLSLGTGAIVDVAGVLGTVNFERVIQTPVIIQTAPAGADNPKELYVTGKWLAGKSPGANVPGLADVYHLFNVGLLVTTAGTIVESGSSIIRIDDGSNMNVHVTSETGVDLSSLPLNAIISATGISSLIDVGGGVLRPCIKIASFSDILRKY